MAGGGVGGFLWRFRRFWQNTGDKRSPTLDRNGWDDPVKKFGTDHYVFPCPILDRYPSKLDLLNEHSMIGNISNYFYHKNVNVYIIGS